MGVWDELDPVAIDMASSNDFSLVALDRKSITGSLYLKFH